MIIKRQVYKVDTWQQKPRIKSHLHKIKDSSVHTFKRAAYVTYQMFLIRQMELPFPVTKGHVVNEHCCLINQAPGMLTS